MSTDKCMLSNRAKAVLNRCRGDATQAAKRMMLHLSLVPPPLRISIDITDRCNFRCPTCSKWKSGFSHKELDTHTWKSVLKKVRNVPFFREISIGGGEPFTRPDILEILTFAKLQKLTIAVISNGWFVNRDMLGQLDDIGVDHLMVSLNSLKESVHDESRAAPGSFNRIMEILENRDQRSGNVDICLSTIIMETNCEELSDLANFAHDKGLRGILFQVLAHEFTHYPFSGTQCTPEAPPDWYVDNPLWVRSIHTLEKEVSRLLSMQKKSTVIINPASQLKAIPLYYGNPDAVMNIPCLGTLSRLHIDPFGNMRLCYGYPPIGNILNDDPRSVWRSSRAREIRLASKKCNRLCRLLNNNI